MKCDNCKQETPAKELVDIPNQYTKFSQVEGWFCAECINQFEREGKIEAEV